MTIQPRHAIISSYTIIYIGSRETSYTCGNTNYSITTFAPRFFIVSTSFSPSSFGTDSFRTFGTASTNFLLSTKLRPRYDLISLIILGFEPASIDSIFRLNSVFSCGAGATSSSAGGVAAAALGAAAAANPPTGRSGMLRRVCRSQLIRNNPV